MTNHTPREVTDKQVCSCRSNTMHHDKIETGADKSEDQEAMLTERLSD